MWALRRRIVPDSGVAPAAAPLLNGRSLSAVYNTKPTNNAPYSGGGWWCVFVVAVLGCVLHVFVCELRAKLPPPGQLEVRARAYLRQLLAHGPRVGGSWQNEVYAVQVLLDSIANISDNLPPGRQIDVDLQTVSGTFDLALVDGVASQYSHVQNVVARLSSCGRSPSSSSIEPDGAACVSDHSVLINCHFDSVSNSPGASDDAVSCAVMLELMRRMAHSRRELKHNIIFLFNGAEENMLQAAHGFITQHKWARSVRVHVNLEACGAGGREIVFQTGPGHPWIIKAFAEVAPHPFANVFAQEIFQSGIIPADTDFRIFRDHGNVPGLDMAFYSNGYVYHTRFDNEHQITPGSIQRAGENVEAILYRLATSDDMVDANKQEVSVVVFADLLGVVMLVVPGWVYVLLSLLTITLTALTINHSLHADGWCYSQLLSTCAVQLVSWLAAGLYLACVALLVDSTGHALCWYSEYAWLYVIYALPSLAVILLVQHTLFNRLFPRWRHSRVSVERLVYESQRALLLPVLLLSLWLRVYSGYLLLLMLLGPTLLRSCLLERIMGVRQGACHTAVSLASQTLSHCFCVYYATTSGELFIPLLGRCGSAIHADLALAAIVLLSVIGCSWYLVSVVTLCDATVAVCRVLLLCAGVSLCLITTNLAAFPYDAARPSPRSQRVIVQHIERIFDDGSGTGSDSGLLINNMDRNSPRLLLPHLPHANTARDMTEECESRLYCALPYYYPIRKVLYRSTYIPGPRPSQITVPVQYTTARRQLDSRHVLIAINVTGPDHMTMQVSACEGVSIVGWSIASGVPLLQSVPLHGRPVYFLYYAYGVQAAPWNLWFRLQISSNHMSSSSSSNDKSCLMDANLNGHYLHGSGVNSSYMTEMTASLPDWMVVTKFTSTLHVLRF